MSAPIIHLLARVGAFMALAVAFGSVAAPAMAAGGAACERHGILDDDWTNRTQRSYDELVVALAEHHCEDGTVADDSVPLRSLNGVYTPRSDNPCPRSEGYLSAVALTEAGGPKFAAIGTPDELLEAQCIADKTEFVKYFHDRPDSCYDAVINPYLYSNKCKWQARVGYEYFQRPPYTGWWITIAVAAFLLIGAAASSRSSTKVQSYPPGTCQYCGSREHSTHYHAGR